MVGWTLEALYVGPDLRPLPLLVAFMVQFAFFVDGRRSLARQARGSRPRGRGRAAARGLRAGGG
jgi:hypothetical protein